MTINRSLGPFFLGAICTLVLTIVPEFAGAQDCHVRIYSYNDDYLEATVDTRARGSNLVLENVSFEVNLRIKEKDQKVAFDFTNADLLRSNHPPDPGRVVGKVPPRSWH